MKLIITDISCRVPLYDMALCKAIKEYIQSEDSFTFLTPPGKVNLDDAWYVNLKEIVPSFLQSHYNIFRRILKALEVFVNYKYLIKYVKKNKIDILHLQWLPMLEKNRYEVGVLKQLRKETRAKIILTVHNIYPHNFNGVQKKNYRDRFMAVVPMIDAFVVHTESSKEELSREFNIDKSKISVIYHGVFHDTNNRAKSESDEKTNLIMFGTQSYYKGTDIFIKAIKQLPEYYREKISCTIVGSTDTGLYKKYKALAEELKFKWIPTFVSKEELHDNIHNSDMFVIPYRSIAQSGVLLKALDYRRPILASDLPSFKETLKGFKEDWFFENGNASSLKDLIIRHLDKKIDEDAQKNIINNLCDLYSWDNSAKRTYELYESILNK